MRKCIIALATIACIAVSCKKEQETIITDMYIENTTLHAVRIEFIITILDQMTMKDSVFSFSSNIQPMEGKKVFSLESLPYYSTFEHPDRYDSAKIYVGSRTFTVKKGQGMLKMDNYVAQPEKTHTQGNHTYYEKIFAFDDNYLNSLLNLAN
ncbi:MAG: hypothetical protein LBT04_09390 [Prevotellaceae bacterium]|jgi:hypothetical protein|nr:hypothetical protein [Prevotellaceae bacterium]